MAHSRIKESGGELEGDGLAIGGLITGYIGIFVTTIAMLGILAGMLLPAVASARERARRARCMANLSQIAKTCVMYQMDHDDGFPPDLKALTGEYIQNMQVFVCPAGGTIPGDPATVDEWSDYVLRPVRDDQNESTAVLLHERPGSHNGRGGMVAYADGAVAWLNAVEFEAVTGDEPLIQTRDL